MYLLEHEAKSILDTCGVPVPRGMRIAKDQPTPPLSLPVVLKSQVPVGGRGKLGGVVIVDSASELRQHIDQLFSLSIKGYQPSALLAEEKLAIKHEHYLSLLIDRDSSTIRLMAHKKGGVEVEDNTATEFFNSAITASSLPDTTSRLALFLDYDATRLLPLIEGLFTAFTKSDATLLEVNPLVVTNDGEFVCGDCKMELDDAAGFRHPEWDFEDKPKNANFVTLHEDGNVATIANGAGLAMATVDAVAASNMVPANFLDIGGGATTESVLAAFTKIQDFPNVQAIVINIFAGITRCDQIASAVITARQQIPSLPPVFIRLAGTNFEEAVALLTHENIPTLGTLEDCLKAAKEVVRG